MLAPMSPSGMRLGMASTVMPCLVGMDGTVGVNMMTLRPLKMVLRTTLGNWIVENQIWMVCLATRFQTIAESCPKHYLVVEN